MSTAFLSRPGMWRRKAGLKQVRLADLAGLTPETVYRYERLQRPASIGSAERLAELLGVAFEVLTWRAAARAGFVIRHFHR